MAMVRICYYIGKTGHGMITIPKTRDNFWDSLAAFDVVNDTHYTDDIDYFDVYYHYEVD